MSEPFSLNMNKASPLVQAALRSAVHQVAGGLKKTKKQNPLHMRS